MAVMLPRPPTVTIFGLHGHAWRITGPRGRAVLVRRCGPGWYAIRYAHGARHVSRGYAGSQRHVLALCERFARRCC